MRCTKVTFVFLVYFCLSLPFPFAQAASVEDDFIKQRVKPRPSGRGCKRERCSRSMRCLLLLNVLSNNRNWRAATTSSEVGWRP